MVFTREAPNERGRRSSNVHVDEGEEDHLSTTSDISRDDLEANLPKKEKIMKCDLRTRFRRYARERKNCWDDWSSAQPRSIWTSIYLVILGISIILYVHPSVVPMLATVKEKARLTATAF